MWMIWITMMVSEEGEEGDSDDDCRRGVELLRE